MSARARAHTCARGERASEQARRQSGHLGAPGNSFRAETHAATRMKPSAAADAAAAVRYTNLFTFHLRPPTIPHRARLSSCSERWTTVSQPRNLSTQPSANRQKSSASRTTFVHKQVALFISVYCEYGAGAGGGLKNHVQPNFKCILKDLSGVYRNMIKTRSAKTNVFFFLKKEKEQSTYV